MWLALNREGTTVARCTVERLMAELGPGRRHPRQVQTHHDCGSGGSASGRSCPTPVRPTGTESAVGRRPDLCLYLVGFRLRGVRGRCLCTPDPGLAGGINDGDLDGARRDRAVYLDASTRRCSRFERCCPPHGSVAMSHAVMASATSVHSRRCRLQILSSGTWCPPARTRCLRRCCSGAVCGDQGGRRQLSASLAQLLGIRGYASTALRPGPIWTPLIPPRCHPRKSRRSERTPARASRAAGRAGAGLRASGLR